MLRQHIFLCMFKIILFIAISVLVLALSCQKPTTTSALAPAATFDKGIYYRTPNFQDPTAILSRVDSPLNTQIVMTPVSFDIRPDSAVYANDDTLYLVSPDGSKKTIKVPNLYQMARPAFSPDGKRVAVQATPISHPPGQTADPGELKIFVISLDTGTPVQISPPSNVPNESPTWFKQSNKVVYSSFSATVGVDLHVYDVDKSQEILLIPGAGWHGIAVSKDDRLLLVPNSMRVYNLQTGAMVSDLRSVISAGIVQTGWQLQTGVGDSKSPFWDGSWSPDGTQFVFDVAVQRNGQTGAVIFTTNADGSSVVVKTNLFSLNPAFSNNLNFSQLDPRWF